MSDPEAPLSRSLGAETERHPPQMQDRTETVAETADLKSLARRVLERDTVRDRVSGRCLAQGEPARRGTASVPETGALVPASYDRCLAALRERCPDLVDERRWHQALEDGRRFVAQWGARAHAFGWTASDLFRLAPVSDMPAPTYRRLSRYDETGLIWLLHGRPVVALTEATAAIENPSDAITVYRKNNKPALGPVGDSFDDLEITRS